MSIGPRLIQRPFSFATLLLLLGVFPSAHGRLTAQEIDSDVTLERLLPLHLNAAKEYTLAEEAEKTPSVLQATPISQWTNIRRSGGQLGHVFVWTNQSEPVAMAAIFSFPWQGEANQRRLVHEMHALSPSQLKVERSTNGVLWEPQSGLQRLTLPGVVSAAPNGGRFKIQVRQIARRVTGYCKFEEGRRWELRVLPTPLMVYPIRREEQVGFGALVGMMGDVGNDLEAGFLVEALKDPAETTTRWQFAPIRMTDKQTYLMFDKQPIWESVRSPTDTRFHDTPNVYFRFQDKTVPL